MSYVDLKHLLADLALEAVQHPRPAGWAAIAAACADHLDADQPSVAWKTVRQDANVLARPFEWTIDERALDHLTDKDLLRKNGDTISIPPRFLPHLQYFKRQTHRLLDVLAELASGAAETGEDVRRGAALFNGRLFFECHEYLEGIWKATSGPEKGFFHGIVQVAAAFYHFEKENWHGATTLMSKGTQKLSKYPDSFLGVNLHAFRRALKSWAGYFADPAGRRRPGDYPRLNLVQPQERQEAPRG